MSILKSLDRRKVLIMSAICAAVAALPFFLYEFGVNNDYFLLWPRDGFWLRYEESHSLVVLGRPLGAVLVSFQTFFYQQISHFSLGRLVSCICLFIVAWRFSDILRRQTSLDAFWVSVVGALFFFLPSNQAALMWTVHFIPGLLNSLIVVVISGFLFASRDIRQPLSVFIRSRTFWLAFFVFWAAFMIYPITALFSTVIAAAMVLFRPASDHNVLRVILRNYTILIVWTMGVYFVADRCAIYPVYRSLAAFPEQADHLRAIAGVAFEPATKLLLIKEMMATALAGHYHMLIGSWSVIPSIAAFAAMAFALTVFAGIRKYLKRELVLMAAERLVWLAGLMMLCIAPILVSKTYNVVNYRTLLCPSVIFLLAWIWMMWSIWQWVQDQRFKVILIGCVSLIAIVQLVTAHLHARSVAENHAMELAFIRKQLRADVSSVDRFVFLGSPSQQYMSLTGQPFFYEFGYMIQGDMVKPIIWERVRRETSAKSFDVTYIPQPFDGHQIIIDMNTAMKPVR